MLYVIPLAHSDLGHLSAFVRGLQAFPPAQGDRVLVIPTPDAEMLDAFKKAILDITGIFGKQRSVVRTLPNTPDGGWPKAANLHFMWAATYVSEMEVEEKKGISWMWLETDCCFLRRGWSEALQVDYRNMGQPFYGVRVPSNLVIEDAKTKELSLMVDGSHLMGVAIYPELYTRGRHGYMHPQTIKSFTIFCQHEHQPMCETPLIVHRARTVNWRHVSGNVFSCEDTHDKSKWAIKYQGEVDLSQAVMVHGCKDGSLLNAILAHPITQQAPEPVVGGQSPAPGTESLQQEIERLRAENLRLTQGHLSRAYAGLGEEGVQSTESPTSGGILPSQVQVAQTLEGGKMRLAAMAEHFGCPDVDAFEKHLAGIGFSSPKPFRWVTPIATEKKTNPQPTPKGSKPMAKPSKKPIKVSV